LASRHNYGSDPSQYGVLYGEGPVAVLIHGGFWKAEYGLELMDALAADLVARGWAAWNIEYRRLGNGGGVPYTLDDVGAAIDHLDQLPGVDLSRVVAIGHSAGGHLAAWAATRDHLRVAVTGVVSQAGVLDLQRAAELRLSNGVVDRFLKSQPTDVASPIERLPLGVPALLTHGGRDDIVPPPVSASYAAAARAAGDAVDVVELADEDHFGHIDPANPLWKAVLEWLA